MWDVAFDTRCEALALRAVSTDPERDRAWQALLLALAPEVERWARANATLRRWGLNGPDDAREVLVRAFERLAANQRASLAEYTRRRSVADPQPDALSRLTRLDELDDDDGPPTPFRAWMRIVVRHTVQDHVRRRLGWVEGLDRRAAGSGADRWSAHPEPAVRPALTDWLTLRERMTAVDAQIDALPADMAAALRRWADGHTFEDIAREGSLGDADDARRVVRAAHARLRHALREVTDGPREGYGVVGTVSSRTR